MRRKIAVNEVSGINSTVIDETFELLFPIA
jgi:hypothetical protein